MRTELHPDILATDAGREADAILRSCVHCGFCTATCPTYQVLGDELDGPRGRIWLIRDMLERDAAGPDTQRHLDRCLTCRSCETTCPSGVRYGRLLDIGRAHLEQRVSRPPLQRLLRAALRHLVPYPRRLRVPLRVGQWLRPLLPAPLRDKVPILQRRLERPAPAGDHVRKVLLLAGCVQSLATPRTNDATTAVLDRLGITAVEAAGAGCCGALPHHLGDPDAARSLARRNVDAWWPLLSATARGVEAGEEGAGAAGAEALVMTASGCGVEVREYGALLAADPAYAARAARIAAVTLDLSEFLVDEDLAGLRLAGRPRVAWHPPCTLQHGQQVRGPVERILDAVGVQRVPVTDSHLCCGSAGTYSILQPRLAGELRARKLEHLTAGAPEVIVTANVGCQTHLASVAELPVRHWIELLADGLREEPLEA
ncbi:MAG TPA: glycolate oxidase subunit GlcF [Pseudomonadales bacterium]|nr:glycolate oxidase subunit GlcF [Pseudomonadales bacterium]